MIVVRPGARGPGGRASGRRIEEYLALMDKMGVKLERFGDSNQRLGEI
jgi:hypothetical protein